ncbi:MAG TPA: hypothetical protein VLL48_14365 [Longimicrobiales bacterium]|nr:hypothetical protein [Longimicrobiales bacterium]
MELEGSGPARWHCGVWLSTWALAPHRVQELQAAPNRTMARVLPESG